MEGILAAFVNVSQYEHFGEEAILLSQKNCKIIKQSLTSKTETISGSQGERKVRDQIDQWIANSLETCSVCSGQSLCCCEPQRLSEGSFPHYSKIPRGRA